MDTTQLQQYIDAYNQAMQSPQAIQMTGGGAQQGMSNFMNSPAYQLQYGSNMAADPAQRFMNDPGVQMAIKAGMPQLQAQYAAKGLGASGPAAQGLSQYMYNNYNNYVNQQGSLFKGYQDQLANLANFGSQQTGATQAVAGQDMLAQLLSGNYMNTSNNIANAYLGTGNNISGLFANQGSLGASAYLNSAAAMSNNILAGNEFGAQLNNAQQQSNAQTQQGQINAMGYQSALGRYF